MVIARGTAIQSSSMMTAGAIMMRDRVLVCAVAMISSAVCCCSSIRPGRDDGPARDEVPEVSPSGVCYLSPGPSTSHGSGDTSSGERRLLDIASAGHVAGGGVLSLGQGIVSRHLAGQSGREQLAHIGGNAGELGDGDELHAGIGHRINGRLGRISRV